MAATIEFIASHHPALVDGEYEISVTQTLKSSKIPPTDSQGVQFSTQRFFAIAGERFDLKPADIYAVFPPEASLGEHSNVLPHVILNRSTLPWERSAIAQTDSGIPWLALLLFDDGQKPVPQVMTLAQLQADSAAKFPIIALESAQHADDKVSVIDVPQSVLQAIMPTQAELGLLTHVRLATDDEGKPLGDEQAIVIGNRLPAKQGLSTVHLVSVEHRFVNNGFDYQNAGADDTIRLVSLKSWSFACIDEKQSFKHLLEKVNRNPGTLRLPPNGTSPITEAQKYAEQCLQMGCVPLPHHLRQGDKTASLYHGPLIPGANNADVAKAGITLPARAADELVRFDGDYGVFDVSYAAAWELGRLVALQSKQNSVNVYRWKRTHAQEQKQSTQRLLSPHLPQNQLLNSSAPNADSSDDDTSLRQKIAAWFDDLSLLQGVPFTYLVPDERMLPPESIRFFCVDHLWVDCLLDGAFSIGRVSKSDHQQDQNLRAEKSPAANPHPQVSGFLLRSDVVSGWPGLLVDGYALAVANQDPKACLPLLRMERLSKNVLFCLFEGEIRRVEIHLKPETLHFGFDKTDASDADATDFYYKKFEKQLRDEQGDEGGIALDANAILWRQELPRILDVQSLASNEKMQAENAAQFAFQMIEGVDKVVFQLDG